MGAGLAKEFKERYPKYYESYRKLCKAHKLFIGKLHEEYEGNKIIISFPTKVHWEDSSTLENIREGLKKLRTSLRQSPIPSIAIPALGCGLGGLDWKDVKPLVYEILGDLEDVSILLYLPKE
jgi:O-acetyl-ADP-ribose deacetylase (regulator of RNase III)